jgi:hypothetical protein
MTPPQFLIETLWEKNKSFFLETSNMIEPKLHMNVILDGAFKS